MTEHVLSGCRILVVEDEFLLADLLAEELEHAGAEVIGPASTIEEATSLIESAGRIDGALLDVNLGGRMAFGIADMLRNGDIMFAFTTGYDPGTLPERFADVPRLCKPLHVSRLAKEFYSLLHR